MDCSTPDSPVLHWLPEFAQINVYWVSDAIYLILCHVPSPFSFCLPSFPASGSFPTSQLFVWGGQSIGTSALASVLQWILKVDRLIPLGLGFPSSSDGKASPCNSGDLGSIPRSGRSLGEGHRNPLQYSCLENFMDRGAWCSTIHGVAESDTIEQLIYTGLTGLIS